MGTYRFIDDSTGSLAAERTDSLVQSEPLLFSLETCQAIQSNAIDRKTSEIITPNQNDADLCNLLNVNRLSGFVVDIHSNKLNAENQYNCFNCKLQNFLENQPKNKEEVLDFIASFRSFLESRRIQMILYLCGIRDYACQLYRNATEYRMKIMRLKITFKEDQRIDELCSRYNAVLELSVEVLQEISARLPADLVHIQNICNPSQLLRLHNELQQNCSVICVEEVGQKASLLFYDFLEVNDFLHSDQIQMLRHKTSQCHVELRCIQTTAEEYLNSTPVAIAIRNDELLDKLQENIERMLRIYE